MPTNGSTIPSTSHIPAIKTFTSHQPICQPSTRHQTIYQQYTIYQLSISHQPIYQPSDHLDHIPREYLPEYLPDRHILQRFTAFQSWLKTLIQPYNYKPEHLIIWTSQIGHQMCTCQSYHIQLRCCCDNEQYIIQEHHGHYTDLEANSFRSGDDWPD